MRMFRYLLVCFAVYSWLAIGVAPTAVFAQNLVRSNDFEIGTVTKIKDQQEVPDDHATYYIQEVEVKMRDGIVHTITAGSEFQPLTQQQLLKTGTKVIVQQQQGITQEGEATRLYVITDIYRLPVFIWLFVGFVLLTIAVAKWQGIFSLVGMGLSFVILTQGIIPPILNGASPILVSVLGGSAIAVVTVYLSHGWERKSHISVIAIITTLVGAVSLAQMSVIIGHLAGLASEEAYYLQFAGVPSLNLQGLLLAGVILGALGILDDIVVSQVSVVKQLSAVGKLDFSQLYFSALAVGKDHVASLVNTLVLAYVGANLPLFLLFYLDATTPLWVTMNSQIVAEELLRTFVGSMSLIIAVPLATLLATYVYVRWPEKLTSAQKKQFAQHGHIH